MARYAMPRTGSRASATPMWDVECTYIVKILDICKIENPFLEEKTRELCDEKMLDMQIEKCIY